MAPDLMRKIPSTYQVFLASRAVMGSLAGTEGRDRDQSVQVSTFASVYLSTGDRLSAAFHNPDAILRENPIWAGVLLQLPPGRGLWQF